MRDRGNWARRGRGAVALLVALFGLAASACGGSSATSARGTATAASPTPVTLDAGLAAQSVYVATLNGATTSNPGALLALNAQTGAVRWNFAPHGMAATPALANGSVYIAPEDDKVYAVNASSGVPRWTYMRADGSANSGFDGYSAISGSVDYVTCDAGSVYALNTADGSLLWHTPVGNGDHIYAAPAVANGLVYVSVGGADNALLALDATTGKERWSAKAAQEVDGTPLAADGAVYVGAGLSLMAVDGVTGAIRWSFPTSGNILTRPAEANGVVYLGSGDETVYAVNAATGKEIWHFATSGTAPTPPLATGAAVTLVGDTLYVGSQGGTVYALNAADGSVRWQRSLNAAVDAPVAVADGAVFAASDAATVYALRASDGALSWQHDEQGSILGSPVVG